MNPIFPPSSKYHLLRMHFRGLIWHLLSSFTSREIRTETRKFSNKVQCMYRAEGKRQKQYNSDALADIKRNKDAYLAIVHIVQE